MRVVLVASPVLVVSSVLSIGCGGGGGDPDAMPPPVDARLADANNAPVITATVNVVSGGPGPVVCQQNHPQRGTDGIRINVRRTGTSMIYSDIFDCDVIMVISPPLPGTGNYDVWIDYIADRGSVDPTDWVVVDATSMVTVDVVGDLNVDATLVLDYGFFEANWMIRDATGAAVPCAEVPGENGVALTGTLSGPGTLYEDIFTCESGSGTAPGVITLPIPLGNYVYVLSVLDANDDAIGQSAAITTSLVDGNQYRDLGLVDILLD